MSAGKVLLAMGEEGQVSLATPPSPVILPVFHTPTDPPLRAGTEHPLLLVDVYYMAWLADGKLLFSISANNHQPPDQPSCPMSVISLRTEAILVIPTALPGREYCPH